MNIDHMLAFYFFRASTQEHSQIMGVASQSNSNIQHQGNNSRTTSFFMLKKKKKRASHEEMSSLTINLSIQDK